MKGKRSKDGKRDTQGFFASMSKQLASCGISQGLKRTIKVQLEEKENWENYEEKNNNVEVLEYLEGLVEQPEINDDYLKNVFELINLETRNIGYHQSFAKNTV